jgi:ribosome biogenesis GTPase / thiamine phosphate phosphatase
MHSETSDSRGTVIAVQANFYRVRVDLETKTEILLCTRRTRLKKIGQNVMVGDRVRIEEADFVDKQGAIAEVLPRKTETRRPPVANAERVLLVFAIEEPALDPRQLSRFLVKAESTGLDIAICLNKIDLVSEELIEHWQKRLHNWGYQPFFLSVIQNIGITDLLDSLADKITLLCGPSGVGKSSLINGLIPSESQRVGSVSGKLQKGRHTTRHVELFALGERRGYIADSPGFNQPDLDIDPDRLAAHFPEARRRLAGGNCQFNDCTHRNEPNCVIRGDWERYEHYLEFLEEAIALDRSRQRTPDEESTLKRKSIRSGQTTYEPKLESKKYRRLSRRSKHQTGEHYEHQTLQDLDNDDEEW